MWKLFKSRWKLYLIEAWALGMFMMATCLFAILFEHPDFYIRQHMPDAMGRRVIMGIAIGITAVLLIYSPWGKRSGAHMNPAFTIANWQMDRITTFDAGFYIIAQFTGGFLGVWVFKVLLPSYMANPSIAYVVTIPGMVPGSEWIALILEFLISFILLFTVLHLSNYERLSRFTGYFVGILLFFYITFEAPYSGMSINPARTVASSWHAGNWTSVWIYFTGPVSGMLCAGMLFRKSYRRKNGECHSMECFMSGNKNGNETYEVLKYREDANPIFRRPG